VSMQLTVREDDIAEAIWRGDLRLGDLLDAVRATSMSNEEFAEFMANDISEFLDDSALQHPPVLEFFETIQTAAETLLSACDTSEDTDQ